MTKHPEITASNYEEVYEYFRTSRASKRFSDVTFSLSDKIYRPDVNHQPGAIETIRQQLELGKGAMLAINHPSQHDPFVMAGAIHEMEKELPEFTDFMGFGKDSLFRGLTRPIFEKTGCVPVFRPQSYQDIDPRTFAQLTTALLQLAADRLQNGQHVSILPEGTRSAPEHLQKLDYADIKTGIARIAMLASDSHSFIVPVGIHYRNANPRSFIVPEGTAVVFGEPITEYAPTTSGIRRQVWGGMQYALNQATQISRN
jgi:1-acyl-sn-glycerol-3-phosphate acyltransferase